MEFPPHVLLNLSKNISPSTDIPDDVELVSSRQCPYCYTIFKELPTGIPTCCLTAVAAYREDLEASVNQAENIFEELT